MKEKKKTLTPAERIEKLSKEIRQRKSKALSNEDLTLQKKIDSMNAKIKMLDEKIAERKAELYKREPHASRLVCEVVRLINRFENAGFLSKFESNAERNKITELINDAVGFIACDKVWGLEDD